MQKKQSSKRKKKKRSMETMNSLCCWSLVTMERQAAGGKPCFAVAIRATEKPRHADIFAGKNYLKHLNESNKISQTNLKSRTGVLVPGRAGK